MSTSNFDAAIQLLKSFSGQQNTITIHKAFIAFMGDIEGALFLSQLIFWSDKGKREDGWIWKTYESWEAETGLSQYKVKKFAEFCTEAGFLETAVMKAQGSPTMHYRLDYEKCVEAIIKNLINGNQIFNNPMENQIFNFPYTDQYHITNTQQGGGQKNGSGQHVYTSSAAEAWQGEIQALFNALEKICIFDDFRTERNQNRATDLAYKMQKEGWTVELLNKAYADKWGWWYSDGWGKDNQKPPRMGGIEQTRQQALPRAKIDLLGLVA